MSSPDTSSALDRILRDLDSAISYQRPSKNDDGANDGVNDDDDDAIVAGAGDEMAEDLAEADQEDLYPIEPVAKEEKEENLSETIGAGIESVTSRIVPLEPTLELEEEEEDVTNLSETPVTSVTTSTNATTTTIDATPMVEPEPEPPIMNAITPTTFTAAAAATIVEPPPMSEEPVVVVEKKVTSVAEDEEHGRQVDRLLEEQTPLPSPSPSSPVVSVSCGRPLLALRLIPNNEARLEIGKSRLQTLLPVPAMMNEPGRERDLRLDRRIVQEKPPLNQLTDLMPGLQADFAQTIDLDPVKEAIRAGWTLPKFHRPLILAKSNPGGNLLRPFVGDFPWPIKTDSLLVALPYGWQSTCPSIGYTLKRLQLPVTVREVVEWIRQYYAKRLGLCMGNARWYGFHALFRHYKEQPNKGLLILVPDVEEPTA